MDLEKELDKEELELANRTFRVAFPEGSESERQEFLESYVKWHKALKPLREEIRASRTLDADDYRTIVGACYS